MSCNNFTNPSFAHSETLYARERFEEPASNVKPITRFRNIPLSYRYCRRISFDAIIDNGNASINSEDISIAEPAKSSKEFWVNAAASSFSPSFERIEHILYLSPSSKELNIAVHAEDSSILLGIDVNAEKSSDFIINFLFSGGGNINTIDKIYLESSAKVEFNKIFDMGEGGSYTGSVFSSGQDNSFLSFNAVYANGKYFRTKNIFDACGKASKAIVKSISIGTSSQQFDIYNEVVNTGENSDVAIYSDALMGGDSKALVKDFADVAPGSYNSISYIKQRGMLLSSDAKISAFPDMGIRNANTKAEHYMSIGAIEEDQLFYVMARGINEKKAKNLIAVSSLLESTNSIKGELAAVAFNRIFEKNFGMNDRYIDLGSLPNGCCGRG
ncbi:MAG: SufB/SufD family protein [Candidatus Micrarchaeia archaeon]